MRKGNVNLCFRLQLINWIGRQNLEFPAGTGWRYTDYNYMVLAYIIEHISKTFRRLHKRKHIYKSRYA